MERDTQTNRRSFIKATGAGVGLAALAGCSGGDGGDGGDGGSDGGDGGGDGGSDGSDGGGSTTTSPSTDPIVIGNAAPLSGNITPWGQLHRAGLDFAAQEINDDGGLLDGREISVVSQDTEANPQSAATVFERLVSNEDAVAVTGPVLSNVAIRVRQVAEELEVPHLPNQGASANLLTKDTRYTFRVSGAATPWFANATGGFIEDNGWTKYGAMIADYAYGRSYQEAMERFITSKDGIESTVQVAPVGAQDFTSQLRQMPDDLEFLDIGGHPIGIFTIVQQARELGLQPAAMSGPNIPTPLFYETLGEAVEEGITLFPPVDTTSDRYVEIGTRFYEATEGYFDPYAAFGYETINLLAAAIEEAGEASPQAIRDSLSSIEYDTLLAYPSISYNEWGELEQTRLIGQQFTLETPEFYPEGSYSFESVHETEIFPPVDPSEWG